MIRTTKDLIKHFESIRRRTQNYLRVIPENQLAWSPKPREFTCADIIRHLIATEKMFIHVAVEGHWNYEGHDSKSEQSLDELIEFLDVSHAEAMNSLKLISDQNLYKSRPRPNVETVKIWHWLIVMAEHEIRHRSQLATYLTLMGIEPPHIFGLGVEDLIAITVT